MGKKLYGIELDQELIRKVDERIKNLKEKEQDYRYKSRTQFIHVALKHELDMED